MKKLILVVVLLWAQFALADVGRIELKVGGKRSVPTKDLVSIEVDEPHIASLKKDPLTGRWTLCGQNPGKTLLKLHFLYTREASVVEVEVKPKEKPKKKTKKTNQRFACKRRGEYFVNAQDCSFVLLGWD